MIVALTGLPIGYSVMVALSFTIANTLESHEISEEVEVEDEQEDNQFEHPSNQSAEQHHSEFTLPHQVKLYLGDH